MLKSKCKNHTNYSIINFIFYGVPYISTTALLAIITGANKWGTYRLTMNSTQMRLYGLFILFLCIYITHSVLIQWPKASGKPKKVKEVLKIFFKSLFLYLWIFSLLVYFIYEIYQIMILKILYYVFIGACLYFQYKFMKKVKKILKVNL